jgi:hypothetical protein
MQLAGDYAPLLSARIGDRVWRLVDARGSAVHHRRFGWDRWDRWVFGSRWYRGVGRLRWGRRLRRHCWRRRHVGVRRLRRHRWHRRIWRCTRTMRHQCPLSDLPRRELHLRDRRRLSLWRLALCAVGLRDSRRRSDQRMPALKRWILHERHRVSGRNQLCVHIGGSEPAALCEDHIWLQWRNRGV